MKQTLLLITLRLGITAELYAFYKNEGNMIKSMFLIRRNLDSKSLEVKGLEVIDYSTSGDF